MAMVFPYVVSLVAIVAIDFYYSKMIWFLLPLTKFS